LEQIGTILKTFSENAFNSIQKIFGGVN
jgi:hypothetical protein